MIEQTPPGTPKRNPMAEEAADWFAKMRGPEAETHRPAFDAWLARGALHLRAYNRAVEIFSDGKFLEGMEAFPSGGPERVGPVDEAPPVRPWMHLLPAMILAACAIMIVGWAVLAKPLKEVSGSNQNSIASERSGQSNQVIYSTQSHEVRTERLVDGSSVTLRPDSMLVILFDNAHRNLRLERGRARFEVAHEQRPFVVYAGGGSVTARGTVFDVNVDTDRHVTVRLERGSVDVVLPASSDRPLPATRLSPGQAVTFDAAPATLVQIPAEPGQVITPAETGMLPPLRDFDRVRLADLVAQANSDAVVPIRLADAALGDRIVSGRFRINDTSKLAHRLAIVFGLQVDQSDSTEILLSSR
jgi:transmembrane sensor